MQQVNVIGIKYVHYFKMNDGTFVEAETTKEDYEQLASSNPKNPTITNGVWSHSMARRKVNTPNGDLAIGQYFNETNGEVVARLADNKDHVQPTMEKMQTLDSEISLGVTLGTIDVVTYSQTDYQLDTM